MSNIAVVTGVASGIGKEAAHDLVARDWTVFGVDIAQDGLDKTTTALASERFHPVVCDIRSAEAVQSTMAEIGNRTGKINALIASAGVMVKALILGAGYRVDRLIAFTSAESDPTGNGNQTIQMLVARGSGGIGGLGLGVSRQ